MRSLALEIASRGVTVNSVAPGIIETADDARAPSTRQRIEQLVPMKRAGTAGRGRRAGRLPDVGGRRLHHRPGHLHQRRHGMSARVARRSSFPPTTRRAPSATWRERALAQSPLVIVVDDGSTDGTAAALEGLPVVAAAQRRATAARRPACAAAPTRRIRRGAGADHHAGRRRPAQPGGHAAAARPRTPRRRARIVIGSRLHEARGDPAGALLGQPLRQFLDRLGGRPSDRRQPVGLPHLPGRAVRQAPRSTTTRRTPSSSRARSSSRRRAWACTPCACRSASIYSDGAPAQPFPAGRRHRAHRAHGGLAPARARPLPAGPGAQLQRAARRRAPGPRTAS